ncbi:MAG TPA: hypothetical protein VLL48_07960, partial [Longimicrobiales bacterium]|nr:hypothetical protein [Longimicrobiales bacterium]
MLFLIAGAAALSAGLVVYLVVGALPTRSRVSEDMMSDVGLDAMLGADAARERSRRSSKLQDLLRYLGEQIESPERNWSETQRRLIHAGYRSEGALANYLGIRFGGAGILFVMGILFGAAADLPGIWALAVGFFGAYAGYTVPSFLLSRRIAARQLE